MFETKKDLQVKHRKFILLLLFLIVICLVIIFLTIKFSKSYINITEKKVYNIEISLKEEKEGIKLDDAYPISDQYAVLKEPYSFRVTNNGNLSGKYEILLEEIPFSIINDGCNNASLLKKEQLKIQIEENGKELYIKNLSDIKSNILDIKEIGPEETINYNVRIWIDKDVENTDWRNKHFHYKITINPLEEKK